ncbi:MAG: recombinase family protein [Propionicimonas sp.]
MRLGYARTSTTAQDPQLQLDALNAAGVDRIYVDQVSGVATRRPELDKLLDNARTGDTIVIWRLDRLGRSMKHLLKLIEDLEHRNIVLVSLNEQIDATSANRRFILRLLASLAAFERDLLSERTKAGLDAARRQGRVGGRPRALSPAAAEAATRMYQEQHTVDQIAANMRVSRATIYRHLHTLDTPPATRTSSSTTSRSARIGMPATRVSPSCSLTRLPGSSRAIHDGRSPHPTHDRTAAHVMTAPVRVHRRRGGADRGLVRCGQRAVAVLPKLRALRESDVDAANHDRGPRQ